MIYVFQAEKKYVPSGTIIVPRTAQGRLATYLGWRNVTFMPLYSRFSIF